MIAGFPKNKKERVEAAAARFVSGLATRKELSGAGNRSPKAAAISRSLKREEFGRSSSWPAKKSLAAASVLVADPNQTLEPTAAAGRGSS